MSIVWEAVSISTSDTEAPNLGTLQINLPQSLGTRETVNLLRYTPHQQVWSEASNRKMATEKLKNYKTQI